MKGGYWIFSALALGGAGALLGAALVPTSIESVKAQDRAVVDGRPALDPAPGDARMDRLRREASAVLFWPVATRDQNFPKMESLFPGRETAVGNRVRALSRGPSIAPMLGGDDGVARLMAENNMAGLIVVRDGKVRLEHYARTLTATGRWPSFSMAKSVTSTLVGAAIRDGAIRSIDDSITIYLPELKGSGYDGVTIRQVLTMTSGVRWNENYADPNSDVARMFAASVPKGADSTLFYLAQLPRVAQPGTRWNYNTGETNLIGVLVQRATKRSLADYLSEKIWRPAGMEASAFWMTDPNGREMGGCCLSVRLRDYARLGLFAMERAPGIVPEGWWQAATGPAVSIGPRRGGFYGYQWWTSPETFDARGIFGQRIHVDPGRKLVIAITANWPQATDQAYEAQAEQLIARLTAATDDNARKAPRGQ